MARDGSSPEVLVPRHDGDCGDWSPDGKRFAFFSIDVANDTSLARVTSSLTTIDLASRTLTRLASLKGVSARPRWSPDGRRIVFHSNPPADGTAPGGRPFAPGNQIYSIAADGSDLTRLTNNQFTDVHPVW
jgi:Tol biopolymer transport system component